MAVSMESNVSSSESVPGVATEGGFSSRLRDEYILIASSPSYRVGLSVEYIITKLSNCPFVAFK